MANRIEAVDFLIPAGTPVAAPVSTLLYESRAMIQAIEVQVPPGPSGLAGFAFWHSNGQQIPKREGQWIIADNDTIRWNVEGYSDQPDWTIVGYNTDVYDHTLRVRLLLEDWQPGGSTTITPPEPVDIEA